MQLFVAFFVVGFLEQNIGTDAGILEHFVLFYSSCGNVHIDTADIAVFMVNGIYGFNTFQNVFDWVVDRVLSGFQGKTFVSHILQGDDLFFDFFLGQFFSCDMLVLMVVRTVDTAVDAVIGKIQRCEHDDTVAVKVFLNLFCQCVHFLGNLWVFAGKQNGGFSMA